MSQNLNWKNVHGIGFDGSRMESTQENKVKVLNQIKKGDVTVEDSDMARLIIHIHKYDDYVDVFYTEDNPQEAIEEMEKSIELAKIGIMNQPISNLPLRSSVEILEEIHDPNLPDITDPNEVLVYCV